MLRTGQGINTCVSQCGFYLVLNHETCVNRYMVIESRHIQGRLPNWLPLPMVSEYVETPAVEDDDLFPKGEIVEFHKRQGIGVVKNAAGKCISFKLETIELIGPKGQPRYVKAGGRVGFDVARTKNGYQITKLKIY